MAPHRDSEIGEKEDGGDGGFSKSVDCGCAKVFNAKDRFIEVQKEKY